MWKISSQFFNLRTNVRNTLFYIGLFGTIYIYIDFIEEPCLLALVTEVPGWFFPEVTLVDK